MEQKKGTVSISGNVENYTQKVAVLSNKDIFTLTDVYYKVYLYLQSEDKAQGRINIGQYQTPIIYFRYGKSAFEITEKDKIKENYRQYGLSGITPFTFNSNWHGQQSIEFSIIAECSVLPTITNLNVDSSLPRQDIKVSWQSERQEKYEITAVTGGNTVYSKTGNTETSHIIPANTFVDGQKVDITVKVLYSDNGNLNSSAWASEKTSITLKQVLPKISQFKPTGSINPLADIDVSWESELQATYKLEIITENKVIQTYTGATVKTVTIPAKTIYNGLVDFKLTISDGYTEVTHTESYNVTNNPKVQILGLEPNGSVRNGSFPIEIAWSSINQKKYLLQIFENEIQKGQFTGLSENSLTLPENYLGVGKIKLILYVYNTVYGEEVQDKREATFDTISKPKPPTFEEKSNFNNAKPIFIWNPDGKQKAYQLLIYKADTLIEDSDIVENDISTYRTTANLENNTTYILKIRTKNQYELWSDYASKEIFISYTLLEPATFTINANEITHSVLINFNSETNAEFKENQIWRADGAGKFKLVARNLGSSGTFIDNYIPGNIELKYKVLSKSKNEATTESDIKSVTVLIKGFVLCDAEDTSQKTNLKFNYSTGFEIVRNRTFIKYLGSKKMIVEDDGSTEYLKGSFVFEMKLQDFDLLLSLYNSNKTLFYRDNRGKALFCGISNLKQEYIFRIPSWVKASFELIEVENKVSAYESSDGDKTLKEVLIDGTWILNSEKDMTGWEWVTI
jgi:hypothetical protein epulo_01891|nr:MAG TPA: hypothetical protein [Caudoviricetes sp.]